MSERSQLIDKLINNKRTRESYIRSKVYTNVASQLRALRRRRGNMTQETLAKEAEMKQSRISAMERPGTRFNAETLIRLAAALGVGVQIRFVPFSEMLHWENSFSQDRFDVTRIEQDIAFINPAAATKVNQEQREAAAAASIPRIPNKEVSTMAAPRPPSFSNSMQPVPSELAPQSRAGMNTAYLSRTNPNLQNAAIAAKSPTTTGSLRQLPLKVRA